MELSSSNIFSKESFSCIPKVSEIFLIIQETKISSGNFLYFRKLKKWNKWTLKNFLVFLEMEVCTPNLKKKLLLIFGELLRAFHCCFFWVFSLSIIDFYDCFRGVFNFQHWFLPLLFVCFHYWLHLFMSPTFFTLTNFFLFFYRECYRFGRSFLTPRLFLPCAWFPHLPQYRKCYGSEIFFTLRRLQPTIINASLRAGSSSLKVRGPPNEV